MKKLLLFALSLGVAATSIAQTAANISVDAFTQPSGTVYIDGSGNGNNLSSIEVTLTNNESTLNFTTGFNLTYSVSLDGSAVNDPLSSSPIWIRQLALDLNAGASTNVTLTQSWAVQTTPGNYELCVSLDFMQQGTNVYMNNDPNGEKCQNFDFDFSSSTTDITHSEISQVQLMDGMMKVFVKNSNQNVRIEVMSITGQVLKTVTPNVSGQNFYSDINVSDLSAGIYLVTVVSENGVSTAKKVYIQ